MHWLALGDVNTLRRQGARTYADLAQADLDRLQLPGITAITVQGGPEWTSADLRRAVSAGFEAGLGFGPGANPGGEPLLVSVMIGTFDHVIDPGADGPRVSLDAFRANVRVTLEAIVAREDLAKRPDGGPCLVVLTPPFCMTGTNKDGLSLSQERLAEYCAVLLELAEGVDAIPVDVNTIFATSVRRSDEKLRRVWTEGGDGLTLNSPAHNLVYPYIRGAALACAPKVANFGA